METRFKDLWAHNVNAAVYTKPVKYLPLVATVDATLPLWMTKGQSIMGFCRMDIYMQTAYSYAKH